MTTLVNIKTKKDLDKLFIEQIKDAYAKLYLTTNDEWYSNMHVDVESLNCEGQEYTFKNDKQDNLQILFLNESLIHRGKILDQFYKGENFNSLAVSSKPQITNED